MRITTWNVRGLLAPDKQRLVKRVLQRADSDIVLFQETKLCMDKALSFLHSCNSWEGFFQEARGTARGLGILWIPQKIKVTKLDKSEHSTFGVVHSLMDNVVFPLINVCGLIKTKEKVKVWKDISDKIDSTYKDRVIVAGDFNALLDLEEKKGGLLMYNKEANKIYKGSFRFQSMWWRDKDFLPNVEAWWIESDIFSETPSFCFVKRLKMVKQKIREWNKVSFKNIFAKKIRVESELDNLNKIIISAGMSNDEFVREKQLKSELSKLLLREEIFWRDKSRERWINEGDLNTKIFHAYIKPNRANNRIAHIQDGVGV
ncbi:uncharacterized protein LOC131859072 [Cryptomeria japonica]|uniref:uncharacterized protein LOC131859072 n=1 Tax=Cryptomeria japonica TaxID=3369 RepID=UPI0027DA718A|nr:uncharacterized protein LOC131859072 [Cryptomeria japonica]